MSFKTRMKKMNRGIALGLIIIVVLIIYIVIDNVRFNQSKEDIENVAETYAQAFADASESDVEGIWKKEDAKSYREGLINVIDKYWSDSSVSTALINGYESKAELVESMEYFDLANNYIGNVKNVKYDFTKVKIKKYGPGGAILTGTVVMTASVPMSESFAYLGGIDSAYSIDWNYGEEDEELEDGKIKSGMVDIVAEIDATMIFTYEAGEWKLCNQSTYFMWEGDVSEPYDVEIIEIGGSTDGNNAEGSGSEDRKSE